LKIVLPRIRDFRGISPTSFDGRGNLNIGLTDQTLFPEIEYDKIDKIRGLEITIVTNSTNDEHSKKLMEKLGLVFMNQN
jgi:large subunit ribosomal protein L5